MKSKSSKLMSSILLLHISSQESTDAEDISSFPKAGYPELNSLFNKVTQFPGTSATKYAHLFTP
jgi:hypothetical protein